MKKTRIRFKISYLYVLITSLSLLLTGCDDNENLKGLQHQMKQTKETIIATTQSEKKNNLSEIQAPTSVTYRSKSQQADLDFIQEEMTLAKNPLQATPLNMLKFVGTLMYDNATLAYVMTPDNKVYQVKIGDIIGDHNGRITKIESDRLEIEEQRHTEGKLIKQVVILYLKE